MTTIDARTLVGRPAVDADGATVGTVSDIYTDPRGGSGGWLAVATGLGGDHVGLVPLLLARSHGDVVRLAVPKRLVHGAPHHDPAMALSVEEEAALFDHYGLDAPTRATVSVTTSGGAIPTAADYRSEDAGRGTLLHEGAAHVDLVRRPADGEHDVTATGPAIYPDDEVAAEIDRDNARREQAARARRAEGR